MQTAMSVYVTDVKTKSRPPTIRKLALEQKPILLFAGKALPFVEAPSTRRLWSEVFRVFVVDCPSFTRYILLINSFVYSIQKLRCVYDYHVLSESTR